MDSAIFSERHGFYEQVESEITIRNEAPPELRGIIVQLAEKYGMSVTALRKLICDLLMKRIDENNWSDVNIRNEIIYLIDNAQWYKVYDIIEIINIKLNNDYFIQQINKYFIKNGIGWQLVDNKIETRNPEASEQIIRQSLRLLDTNDNYQTTHKELHHAISDLSIRPESDNTGAVQHSMAALECFMRDVCDSKDTLGRILQKNKGIIPNPLPDAIEKLWGYASENGRHLKEGQIPTYADAQLIVGICATIITYLLTKNIKPIENIEADTIDIPF